MCVWKGRKRAEETETSLTTPHSLRGLGRRRRMGQDENHSFRDSMVSVTTFRI